jgi:hypothetical protein
MESVFFCGQLFRRLFFVDLEKSLKIKKVSKMKF